MEIKVSEIIEDKTGVRFKHYVRQQEFPETEGRHCDLCVVCGFPAYPQCRDWCAHHGYEAESAREAEKMNKE